MFQYFYWTEIFNIMDRRGREGTLEYAKCAERSMLRELKRPGGAYYALSFRLLKEEYYFDFGNLIPPFDLSL